MGKQLDSFKYAWKGIWSAIKTERHMQIHLVAMAIVVAGGIFFRISRSEWIACVLCFGMVIGAELMNTAIEAVVDLASPERQPLAGRAKDVAAGAVLFIAICAAIVGFIIFLPKVWAYFTALA